MFSLDCLFIDHPNISYFLKSIKMTRPLSVTDRSIITINILHSSGLNHDLSGDMLASYHRNLDPLVFAPLTKNCFLHPEINMALCQFNCGQ